MRRSQKNFIFRIGLTGIILVLMGALMLIPKHRERIRLEAEIAQLSGDNLQVKNLILTSHKLGESIKGILNQLNYYRSRVPSREILPEILDEIGSRALDYNLKVISLEPMGDALYALSEGNMLVQGSMEMREIIFALKVQGSYVGIGQYIAALESAPYAFLIKEVTLINPKAGSAEVVKTEPVLDANLRISILMRQKNTQSGLTQQGG